MPYVDVNGVHTYYETEGHGEPLLLLHGGACPIETWAAQRPPLAAKYAVYLPERRAHGRTADVDGPITYEIMADDTIAFMEALGITNAHVVGWSDGGDVGMIMAIRHPEMVRTLVSIGGNFNFAGLSDEFLAYARAMTPDTFLAPLRALYESLSPDGPQHFRVVLDKLKAMWLNGPTLAPADLARIAAPTLILVGDADVPTWEHTIELYRSVPNAQLCVVPGASHAVLLEKPAVVNATLLDFLASPARSPSAL